MTPDYRHNQDLPWGHWMRVVPGSCSVVDDEGRQWRSVREALWSGRLGMGLGGRHIDGLLETMLAVLAVLDRRTIPTTAETVGDVFDGSGHFRVHYMAWLVGCGLIKAEAAVSNGRSDELTPEGRAVMLMLAATRPQELGRHPVGPQTIAAMIGQPTRDHRLARRLDEADQAGEDLPFRFRRETIMGLHCVTLSGDRLGWSMPMRRTVWSTSFDDEGSRDRLHGWLCERMDRWQVWGREAYDRGAAAWSQTLISLIAADMPRS